MSDKNLKQIRGQIRQIVKEMLPEILNNETLTALRDSNKADLENIRQSIENTLANMDQRSKDTQAFIMRDVLSRSPAPKSE